ncbi:MAG: NAD(P)-dependent alcohol dehydrogenase [Bacteroides sp.]|nr:NAD(P)-dependent alcohol dehydrogenase [Bacteroides sp.]
MEKMKAIRYDKKGTPGKLSLSEVDKPVPKDHELLVRVHAVSLNAADYRSMKMGIIPKKRIFGADVAGTVEAAGEKTAMFKPGDEVMADLAGFGFGGLAGYVAAPERAFVLKPAGVSFEDAATLPLAGVTALQALRDKGSIQKDEKVLIVGSAGSVGSFAVQLAKWFGAEVTGVCSSGKISQTLAIGADHAIDYTRERFWDSDKRYDLILAINGNYPLRAYRKALTPRGRYVMVGGSLSQIIRSLAFGWILSLGSKKMRSLSAKPSQHDLALLGSLLEKGVIKPVIDSRYTLAEATEAMNYLSQGHASGKVVIRIE